MTDRGQARPDNRISFTDQVMFLAMRATGQESVMQGVWVYEHPVDFDGLARFHANVGHGLFARHIECSPLPFGRHRWVKAVGSRPSLDIAESARPRAELSDWLDERAQLPIDPEWGPSWSMGVLPLTDGSTAVSLVASHCQGDGGAALMAILDGVLGNIRDAGYPAPRSGSRLRAAAADARQTLRDAPEIARALGAGVRLTYRRRHDFVRSKEARPVAIRSDGADRNVVVPAVSVYIDIDDWDARAQALQGNSYSLVAGFAAKLAEHLGRRRSSDGAVTLNIPVSDRTTLDDTRGNAVALFNISLDPTQVAKDLSGTRAALKQAVKTAREVPDEALELLPLIPFVPKRAVKKLADVLFGFAADLPVSCSNVGDLPLEIACVDGTPAEYVGLRGVDRRITQELLEQRCGLLTLVVGRVNGKMSISIIAYQPGGTNTKVHLRELAAQTLAEFELSGVVD
jgi:hypothetical protein